MKYDILNRLADEVQFTAEIDCDECAGTRENQGDAVMTIGSNDDNFANMNSQPPFLARWGWVLIAALIVFLSVMFFTKALPQMLHDAAHFNEWSEE